MLYLSFWVFSRSGELGTVHRFGGGCGAHMWLNTHKQGSTTYAGFILSLVHSVCAILGQTIKDLERLWFQLLFHILESEGVMEELG